MIESFQSSFEPKQNEKEILIPRSQLMQMKAEKKMHQRQNIRAKTASQGYRQKMSENQQQQPFHNNLSAQQQQSNYTTSKFARYKENYGQQTDITKDLFKTYTHMVNMSSNQEEINNKSDNNACVQTTISQNDSNIQLHQSVIPKRKYEKKFRSQSEFGEQRSFKQFIEKKYSDSKNLMLDNRSKFILRQQTGLNINLNTKGPKINNFQALNQSTCQSQFNQGNKIKQTTMNDFTPIYHQYPNDNQQNNQEQFIKSTSFSQNFNFGSKQDKKSDYYKEIKQNISQNVQKSIKASNPHSKISHARTSQNFYVTKLNIEESSMDNLQNIFNTPKLQYVNLKYYQNLKRKMANQEIFKELSVDYQQQNSVSEEEEQQQYYKVLMNNMTSNDKEAKKENMKYFNNQINKQVEHIKNQSFNSHVAKEENLNRVSLEDMNLQQSKQFKIQIEQRYQKLLRSALNSENGLKKLKKKNSSSVQKQQQLKTNQEFFMDEKDKNSQIYYRNPKNYLPQYKVNSCFQSPVDQQQFQSFCLQKSQLTNSNNNNSGQKYFKGEEFKQSKGGKKNIKIRSSTLQESQTPLNCKKQLQI